MRSEGYIVAYTQKYYTQIANEINNLFISDVLMYIQSSKVDSDEHYPPLSLLPVNDSLELYLSPWSFETA